MITKVAEVSTPPCVTLDKLLAHYQADFEMECEEIVKGVQEDFGIDMNVDKDDLTYAAKLETFGNLEYISAALLDYSANPLHDCQESVVACSSACNMSNNLCPCNEIYAMCNKCKSKQPICKAPAVWILDSGASFHFTFEMNNFLLCEPIKEKIVVNTSNFQTSIVGKGSVVLDTVGNKTVVVAPVFYIPDLRARLLLLGTFLRHGLTLNSSVIEMRLMKGKEDFLTFCPRFSVDTNYIIEERIHSDANQSMFNNTTIYGVDYDIMHCRMGHPSREALRRAQKNTLNFPQISIPSQNPICPGCTQGKMHDTSHLPSLKQATRPFELIHSSLKEFPTVSYSKYKWAVVFVDDYTSYAWTVLLRSKDKTLHATKQFLATVEAQYSSKVAHWMSDAGGKYKSKAFTDMLKDKGIQILQSTSYTPQQNGRAERFIRTMMDKEESMQHEACIPPSWWEFALLHAVHLYNRTPVERLKWRTPFELLNKEQPRVDHLQVFGCGAYVYLPEAVRKNKLLPKSELMTYRGVPAGQHGFLLMCSNNSVFNGNQALFDEKLYPQCTHPQK